MALFDQPDRHFAEAMSQLVNCNPFHPRWLELEEQALGLEYRKPKGGYSPYSELDFTKLPPNLRKLGARVDRVVTEAQKRLAEGASASDEDRHLHEDDNVLQYLRGWFASASDEDRRLYEDLALYHLYRHRAGPLDDIVKAGETGKAAPNVKPMWDSFLEKFNDLFLGAGQTFPSGYLPEHIFAWFFQLRRAFYHIYHKVAGTSEPAARLRWEVWQSIFTHDMRRWTRALYRRMADFPTLITGPSGTGKELVARAVGLSRYLPFDRTRMQFQIGTNGRLSENAFTQSFYPVNLSALATTLIESEMFGHKKGSFTGAVSDRTGRLEECEQYGEHGTVFLDEIGELDPGIQVKLLRVLQARVFQKLGENKDRQFHGKIIAATNRDLGAEMRAGRFREDFYYRLCADRITTPTLREQLADAPDDLHNLLLYITRRNISERDAAATAEAELLADEVGDWIRKNLGRDYAWPGNFRELEQCVRNVMIRQTYEPVQTRVAAGADDPRQALAAAVAEGALTARELERRYFTLVYAESGSYQEAAKRLGCNWRTLRGKIDRDLCRQLRVRAAVGQKQPNGTHPGPN
jgi:DNA-binding NtrC family response regulator